jgi:multisubunit Na+/H+ antiporter MnhB subunit
MNDSPSARGAGAVFALLVALMVGALGWAILALPAEAAGLAPAVREHLDSSGARNPVTAVLLNFRAYDTLLEIAVLVLAGLGARTLVGGERVQAQIVAGPVNPLLAGFVRVIAPVTIVVVGYLLWVGGDAPGGAFQAGALLGSLGVLLLVSGVRWTRPVGDRLERGAVALGLCCFVVGGAAVMSPERSFLEFRPPSAKGLILAILDELFAGGRLRAAGEDPPAGEENADS